MKDEDVQATKEKLKELKLNQAKEKMKSLKDKIKEKKEEIDVNMVKTKNNVRYDFTDRQVIIHGKGKEAKAYMINYNPGETHAVLQLVSENVPGALSQKNKVTQKRIQIIFNHQLNKIKNLTGGNDE